MPKIVDREEYRRQLLRKSFDVLAKEGYANVTTRHLAKVIGISTGAMYHYFPSKKALFEQLVEEMGKDDVFALQQVVADATSLKERLAALRNFLLDNEDYFVKQTVVWTEFCMNNDLDDASHNQMFQRVDDRYREAITEVLKLKDRRLAQFIWTLVNGLLLEQVYSRNSDIFTEQVELLVEMLVAYLERSAS